MRFSSVAIIRFASVRSSFFSSFAAAGKNSIVQAKLDFQRGQGDCILAAKIAEPFFGEEEIFEVVEMCLDRLARLECLGAPGFGRKPIQPFLDILAQSNR